MSETLVSDTPSTSTTSTLEFKTKAPIKKKKVKLVLIDDEPQKYNIYTNEEYLTAQEEARIFETSQQAEHYRNIFCLKECSNICGEKTIVDAYDKLQPYIENTLSEILSHNKKRLCVLLKGHEGKCESEPKKIFVSDNPTTKKILSSISLCIYNTPGDDDYVYKNRASRLFPIPLSRKMEKTIRNKEIKLRCAIPLCEHTTPFMMATAYIDWICYTLSLSDISEFINPTLLAQHEEFIRVILSTHKTFLTETFEKFNRRIFDDNGYSICGIKRNVLITKNMSDVSRDNRISIDNDDIQMGHIQSRRDNHFTIRGVNLVMMTREGNRIIGEDSFVENDWIEKLKKIVSCY